MTIDSPAAILYDNQGNPVGVVLEGVVYKLQAQVTGAASNGSAVAGNPVLVGGTDGYHAYSFKADAKGDGYTVLTSPQALSNQYVYVTPYNNLRATIEPSTLLTDKFDGYVLDTTRWKVEANLLPPGVVINGNLDISIGTTAGGYSNVISNPVFTQEANVYLQLGVVLSFESPILTNTHRFFGFGTSGNNTAANPLNDAAGFEIDILGNLNAVVYTGGTKIFSQTVPTNLLNNGFNRYLVIWRTDRVFFHVNTSEFAFATANVQLTNTQSLPVRFHSVNNTPGPTSGVTFKIAAIGLADTGRNNVSISDPKYQWQRLSVDSTGSIPLQESAPDNTPAPKRGIQLAAQSSDGILKILDAITDGGQLLGVQDEDMGNISRQILMELKKISFYLSQMSDINLTDRETE